MSKEEKHSVLDFVQSSKVSWKRQGFHKTLFARIIYVYWITARGIIEEPGVVWPGVLYVVYKYHPNTISFLQTASKTTIFKRIAFFLLEMERKHHSFFL